MNKKECKHKATKKQVIDGTEIVVWSCYCTKHKQEIVSSTCYKCPDYEENVTTENLQREILCVLVPDKDFIINILANPKHWCPNKKEQWNRIADALIKAIKTREIFK